MDIMLVKQLQLDTEMLPKPMVAHKLNGRFLFNITHFTSAVDLCLSGNHSENLTFHLIDSPLLKLILSYPWLKLHNPHIDLTELRVIIIWNVAWTRLSLCFLWAVHCLPWVRSGMRWRGFRSPRFSKKVHFIALPTWPSAKETAEALLHHVFQLHGLPHDVVSD